MCSVSFTLTRHSRNAVERQLKTAQQLGHLRQVKYLLAILAVGDGQSFAEVALVLRVHEKTVATWIREFCCYGLLGTRVLLLWHHRGTATEAHRPPPQADPDAESRTRHPH